MLSVSGRVHVLSKQVSTLLLTVGPLLQSYHLKYIKKLPRSGQVPNFPPVKLVLSDNESFVVQKPLFIIQGTQGILGYCLALQIIPGDVAIIGQNFMTGYRMVFDRENLQFGWSRSDCQDHSNSTSDANKPPNSLPTDEEQRRRGHAVAPAIAGRAPSNTSDASRSVNVFLSRLLCVLIFSGMNMLKYAM